MLTGNFALIIEGQLPSDGKVPPYMEVMYSCIVASSTLLLFLSIVVGITVLHRTEEKTKRDKAEHAQATRNVMMALNTSANSRHSKQKRYLSRVQEQEECAKVLSKATGLLVKYYLFQENRVLSDTTKQFWARRLEVMFWLGTFLMGAGCAGESRIDHYRCTRKSHPHNAPPSPPPHLPYLSAPCFAELFYCRMRWSYNNDVAADLFFWIMCSALPGTILIYYVVAPKALKEMTVNKVETQEVKVEKGQSADTYLRQAKKRRGSSTDILSRSGRSRGYLS